MASTSTKLNVLDAPVGVLHDGGNKVVITICIPGLKKQKKIFRKFINVFQKSDNPFHLASNVKFGSYTLTSNSINFSVEIYENSAALKKCQSDTIKKTFQCKIDKFPSKINPDSAEFKLLEGKSGDCYLVLTCMKTDNFNTNWKEFLSTHGTLDLTKV